MKKPAKSTKPASPKKIRRCKYDPERTPLQLLEVIVQGGTLADAAKRVRLSTSVIEHHRRRQPYLDGVLRTAFDLQRWVKDHVTGLLSVRDDALKDQEQESFADYFLGTLPPNLRKVWDVLDNAESDFESSDVFTAMTASMSKRMRQRLFVQCYISHGFSISRACRRTGISRPLFDFWCAQDPEFAGLIAEVKRQQKDFCEEALMDLIAMRQPQAVIFANRTLNKDRGYSESVDVNVTSHNDFSIDDLDLSVECRREILAAMRKKQAQVVEGSVMRHIENKGEDDQDFDEE